MDAHPACGVHYVEGEEGEGEGGGCLRDGIHPEPGPVGNRGKEAWHLSEISEGD